MAFGFFSSNISRDMVFNIIKESLDGVIDVADFWHV